MLMTGIIGYPLNTTFSPALHNAAFALTGINGMYVRMPVKNADLDAAVSGLHALGFAGVNVTVPYKERIAGLVHRAVGPAQEIGAVNTIVNHNHMLYGYNTDIDGFQQSLEDHRIVIRDRKIVLLGAGGAGSACAYVLQRMKPNMLFIADQVRTRARACARRFDGEVVALDGVPAVVKVADVVINATPVNFQHTVIPQLQSGAVYYDINYTFRMMKRKGVKTVNGLRMLILQGAQSFCLWTGHEMPVKRVLQHVGLKL